MLWPDGLVLCNGRQRVNLFLGLNLEKRESVKYVAGENLGRHLRSPKFKRLEIYGECFEVIKKKARQTDMVPVHIGRIKHKNKNL